MSEVSDFLEDTAGLENSDCDWFEFKTPHHRQAHLKQKYDLTVRAFDKMSKAQGGVCVICGGTNSNGKELFVDHDHKTGNIRGLLCSNCNSTLGFARDNPEILKNCIDYLDKHNKKR